mmetsp:Transcript_100930/g.200494  ORF Transcript_100930/g.200494 Transcript_100930/m.200494 type:complete len:558 (+) Transcript_100930:87-1760(+)|eukprot:CAMPEP_0172673272 /NCGR_PEP_ID=MMETSP1074-20121228/12046_1 /TAXON_ID=2916 /ORGANISM="Ceratium fusus, Strain PA161109" /LENGTH=557 /DNA_ID=CAMNT_0013490547 /DNA_START=68 /DNA_END=1741 /DNA_ORIENTATION=-
MAELDVLSVNLCAFHEENIVFAPAVPLPLPIIVVTGFLGSGKTTLLERLLSERANLRVAAAAHDLAANINVDAQLLTETPVPVANSDGAVVSLNGCGCCDDFEAAIKIAVRSALREGVDAGRLDYLLLETSGAADPRRLVAALEQNFGPCTRARLDRVVAVIDADQATLGGKSWLAKPSSNEEHVQLAQLSCADVVLLNKVDLVTPEALAVAATRIAEICPRARVLQCRFCEVPLAEILEVTALQPELGQMTHEAVPAAWVVPQDLEPRQRLATTAETNAKLPLAPLARHIASHRVVEWRAEAQPVYLTRLQELLAKRLPVCQEQLRRGKGLLWVAEDACARWEWQLSGRLRYSCRREADSFRGTAAWSCLVLIFVAGVSNAEVQTVEDALATLTQPPPVVSAAQSQEVAESIASCSPGFEILRPPLPLARVRGVAETEVPEDNVIRFRLTGRSFFNIPLEVDLNDPPYRIDIDAMNWELARTVSSAQGSSFLAVGCGSASDGSDACTALLWPIGVDDVGSEGPSILLFSLLATLSREAPLLLRRSFGHVTSCQCGQ